MRVIHGWVKLGSDCIILGLDSYQFHLYHVMRALAVPKSAQDDSPGLCDVSNTKLALVTRCSRYTVIKLKKELLTMGLLANRGKQYFVLDPPVETLHNHKVVLDQISDFLQANGGTHAPLNAARRRNGHRHERQDTKKVCPPLTPTVNPVDTHCQPQQHPLSTPLTPTVNPVDTFTICPDSVQEKKRRREEEKKDARTAARPVKPPGDPRVTTILETLAKELGYKVPNYARCAGEIKKALVLGYSEEEFVGCWRELRGFRSRQGKWLPLVAVVENLGEYRAGRLRNSAGGQPRAVRSEVNPDRSIWEKPW